MKLAVAALALLVGLAGAASAQTRFPRVQADIPVVRTYPGCFVDSGRHLNLRNTTPGVIRVGTPVYWTGKQAGQPPREYRAPVYLDVAPGGVYQIGGGYTYDPSVACQAWILRPPT